MDWYEEAVTCPKCRQAVAVEYVTDATALEPAAIDARCPECSAIIHIELPRPALSFAARRKGAVSILRDRTNVAKSRRPTP